MPYPHQMDYVWLASDRAGHLAAFTTGGEGPVPQRILNWPEPLPAIEERLLTMPCIGWGTCMKPDYLPESFVALSERGLFVYDWSDVHEPASRKKFAYELISTPETPLPLELLPGELADLIHQFSDLDFGQKHIAWQ